MSGCFRCQDMHRRTLLNRNGNVTESGSSGEWDQVGSLGEQEEECVELTNSCAVLWTLLIFLIF